MYQHVPHSLASCISKGREGGVVHVVHVVTHRMNVAPVLCKQTQISFITFSVVHTSTVLLLHVLYLFYMTDSCAKRCFLASIPPRTCVYLWLLTLLLSVEASGFCCLLAVQQLDSAVI